RQRAALYLAEWTEGRGLNITKPTSAVSLMLSARLRKELRRRLLTLAVRKIPTLTPFMVGAAIGALLNHYDTTRLTQAIRADLRAPGPLARAAHAGVGCRLLSHRRSVYVLVFSPCCRREDRGA
ncbi:hypothetical protein ABT317_46070, partial [Streptomyces carpinensis]